MQHVRAHAHTGRLAFPFWLVTLLALASPGESQVLYGSLVGHVTDTSLTFSISSCYGTGART